MPVPYVQECQEAMNGVSSKKAAIVEAINKVEGLADDETWSGDPADTWMTDLNGHLTDALAELGATLDDAKVDCMKHAQELQAQSARAATTAAATPPK